MSIFVFFRYSQTTVLPHWASTEADIKVFALYIGVVLGCLHWLSNLIVDFSFVSRLPYLASLVVKGSLLLGGAVCIAGFMQFIELWEVHNRISTLWQIDATNIIQSSAFHLLLLYMVFIRLSLAFVEQMGLLVGPKELVNIALGKYHRPRYEQRLFIYLDMTNSTAHAEQLGDYRFSCLIQDCFKLLADPVTDNKGEIYRYMGDAVLIHWSLKDGLEKQRCINLYKEFNQILKWRSKFFKQKYGLIPQFKAALHCGQVVTAVVGVQKQEISFFSDVLNTLARLQDQCGPLKQRLLISAAVAIRLQQTCNADLIDLGKIKLKGKQHSMQVFAVKDGEVNH